VTPKSSCRPKIDFSRRTPKNHLQENSMFFYNALTSTQRVSIKNHQKGENESGGKNLAGLDQIEKFWDPSVLFEI